MKICHVTSVHPRNDARIFLKEAVSAESAGYTLSLVVADGLGDKTISNVRIQDTGAPRRRLDRVFMKSFHVSYKALKTKSDLYHFHDPELLPFALLFKLLGNKVIFDSHEDIGIQILSKSHIHRLLRPFISKLVQILERFVYSWIDGVIGATPTITKKISRNSRRSATIHNYPILQEFQKLNKKKKSRSDICYVGNITVERGIFEMLEVLSYLGSDTKLHLAGKFASAELRERLEASPSWGKVVYYGQLDRDGVREVLEKCSLGLALLHPIENYYYSLPVKVFEYMSAGLVVICSDFPNLIDVVEKNNCGVCIDPLSTKKIASIIEEFLHDSVKSELFSENSCKAVQAKFNWESEAKTLLDLYGQVLIK